MGLHGAAFDHFIVHLIDALLFRPCNFGFTLLEECLRRCVFTTSFLDQPRRQSVLLEIAKRSEAAASPSPRRSRRERTMTLTRLSEGAGVP